jgi:hypothetical protein
VVPPIHSVYVLDADDRVTGVNDAWRAFAVENGAPELADGVLGRRVWEFMSGGDADAVYRALFASVREGRTVAVPYRCDAPSRTREFELVLSPRSGGAIECATRVLGERERPPVPLLDAGAPRRDDFLHMCGWCKRVNLQDAWVSAEEAVQRLALFAGGPVPRVTHGICPDCADRLFHAVA